MPAYPLDPKTIIRKIDEISSSAGVVPAPIQNTYVAMAAIICTFRTWLKQNNYATGYFLPKAPAQQVATGDGTDAYAFYLPYKPVSVGSLTITAPTEGYVVTDAGDGTLTGDATGTINYTTGWVDITAFTGNIGNGNAINGAWEVVGGDDRPRSGYPETLTYADKATYETAYDNLNSALDDVFTYMRNILDLLK